MEEKLIEIEGYFKQLELMVPDEIDVYFEKLDNRLPFKVIVLRDGLIHRGVDIAEVTIELYKNRKMIPAIVLTRSLFESTALIFSLHEKVQQFVKDRNSSNLEAFLEKGTLGSKNHITDYESINALTTIDKLDKKHEGLREMYDTLSEHAHPNWAGTFGSYIRVNDKKNAFNLGPNGGSLSTVGLPPFGIALVVFIFCYERLIEIVPELVEICGNTKINT